MRAENFTVNHIRLALSLAHEASWKVCNTYSHPIVALHIVRLDEKFGLIVDFTMIVTLCIEWRMEKEKIRNFEIENDGRTFETENDV